MQQSNHRSPKFLFCLILHLKIVIQMIEKNEANIAKIVIIREQHHYSCGIFLHFFITNLSHFGFLV